MKNRTIVVILILTSLLFLQIEAARTGWLSWLKHSLMQNLSFSVVAAVLLLLFVLVLLYTAFFDRSLNLNEGRKHERPGF